MRVVLFGALALAAACTGPAALPPTMRGVWGLSAEACVNADDDGRAEVMADAVAFKLSHYALRRIAARADSVHAEALVQEEGEEAPVASWIELQLTGPDSLTVTTSAGAMDYRRCPS